MPLTASALLGGKWCSSCSMSAWNLTNLQFTQVREFKFLNVRFFNKLGLGFGTWPTFSSLLRWRNFEFLSFDDPQKYFLKSERLFWTKSQRNFFITFFPSSELSKAKAMRVLFARQWRRYLFSNPEVLSLNPPDVFFITCFSVMCSLNMLSSKRWIFTDFS